MCNCKKLYSKKLQMNNWYKISESLLFDNIWSPKGLLLFQILVSFSLLKVTFDGLLDTFPPWIQYVRPGSRAWQYWSLLHAVMIQIYNIRYYCKLLKNKAEKRFQCCFWDKKVLILDLTNSLHKYKWLGLEM